MYNCLSRNGSQIVKRRQTNEAKPLEVVHEICLQFTAEVLNKLFERLLRLTEAVIEAEGGYFEEKYAPC
jgi:hypothetical protein